MHTKLSLLSGVVDNPIYNKALHRLWWLCNILKNFKAECCNLKRACYNAHHLIHHGDENDPVAQLDRVSVSEAGGHEFDSHRGRQSRFYFMRKWRNW